LINDQKCRILVDRYDTIASARLIFIAVAGEVTVRLIDLRTVDRSAAIALTIVFQASIFVVISCASLVKNSETRGYGHTFAECYTFLNGHGFEIKIGVIKKTPGATVIFETASIDERSKVDARGLGGRSSALDATTSIDTRNDCQDSRSCGVKLEVHDEFEPDP
jgi:hypothetical protein